MNIQKATAKAMEIDGYITRESWRNILTETPCAAAIKIQPTDTPDGCIIESAATKSIRHGWQPTAEDLVADDWEVVAF